MEFFLYYNYTKLFFCLEVFFTYIYYFLINFDNSDFDESCFF
nr:MAG TPA: hypothetical protein [Microviridae sp.]